MTQFRIVDYLPEYFDAFRELNYQWIDEYFSVEQVDRDVLENPQSKIIEKGGAILIALDDHQAVGTCSLLKESDDRYELSKMAVAESARGKGLGLLLGEAIIERAIALGAKEVFLESNTVLKPAISLYKKLGFKPIPNSDSIYNRCNVQMQLRVP